MLPRSPETYAFWQAFRRYAGLEHNNYVVGSFGDTPEMATELADLVIAGIKRATASLGRGAAHGFAPDSSLERTGFELSVPLPDWGGAGPLGGSAICNAHIAVMDEKA